MPDDLGVTKITSLAKEVVAHFGWANYEEWSDKVVINSQLHLNLLGLSVNKAGRILTGSSASREPKDTLKAYAELIERIVVCEAGSAVKIAAGSGYQPSLSNGVSFALCWEDACEFAAVELIERHLILDSWLHQRRPTPWSWQPVASEMLQEEYQTVGIDFGSVYWEGSEVLSAGWFLFPKQPQLPFVCGFGASRIAAQARNKAVEEGLQRLGFLFGEPIVTEDPEYEPSALYHQDYYLNPKNHRFIRDWLAAPTAAAVPQELDFAFVDLTPAMFAGEFRVVQALCSQATPLVFGDATRVPFYQGVTPIHPVHPLA